MGVFAFQLCGLLSLIMQEAQLSYFSFLLIMFRKAYKAQWQVGVQVSENELAKN